MLRDGLVSAPAPVTLRITGCREDMVVALTTKSRALQARSVDVRVNGFCMLQHPMVQIQP